MRTSAGSPNQVVKHDLLTEKRPELVSQGVVDAVLGRPFDIKVANWSKDAMKIPKRMEVARCSSFSTVMLSLLDEPVRAVQLYKSR